MNSRNKNILIGGLLAIVCIMGIGYAAFATSLNINGSASVSSKWDVHIKSITAGAPVGTASGSAKLTDNLNATFSTDLKSPGDSMTYTVVVENGGTLDAKLSDITFNPGTANDTAAIDYTYSGIAENDVLKHGDTGNTQTFTVTVTYDSSVTSQPASNLLKNDLTMTLVYVQA